MAALPVVFPDGAFTDEAWAGSTAKIPMTGERDTMHGCGAVLAHSCHHSAW